MTAVATPETRIAPAPAPTHTERENPIVSGATLKTLERGVDYTGKLELVSKGTYAIWHQDFPGEVERAQAVLTDSLKAGSTAFDVSGGMDQATRVTTISPDIADLVMVAPIVGG